MTANDQRALLLRSGNALYGERWQSALAQDLNVGARRVREWLAGDRSIPSGIWPDIAALLRAKQQEIADLLPDLD